MFVFDKMVLEDRLSEETESTEPDGSEEMTLVPLPDGTTMLLGPSTRDAFSVFEDLCLLANSEKPHFLKLDFLHKTFALELIESVLTNYHSLFRKVICIEINQRLILTGSYPSIRSSYSSYDTIFVPSC